MNLLQQEKRSKQSFIELFSKKKQVLRSIFIRNGVPEHDIDDLYQTLGEKICLHWKQCEKNPSAWMEQIARNLAKSHYRQKLAQKNQMPGYLEEQVEHSTPFEHVQIAEVLEVLETLPDERTKIVKKRMQGYNYREIELSHGVPRSTIGFWLKEVRVVLQEKGFLGLLFLCLFGKKKSLFRFGALSSLGLILGFGMFWAANADNSPKRPKNLKNSRTKVAKTIKTLKSTVLLADKSKKSKMAFWRVPRRGTNFFNQVPTKARFAAARSKGIEFVRLAPNKWRSARRDFLLGDTDRYRGLVNSDLKRLISVLDWAHQAGLKVVLTTLSLPGARWRQQNRGKDDLKLWKNRTYQKQSAIFWKALATQLRNHPAIVGYNIKNEPHPERLFSVSTYKYQTKNLLKWYQKIKGTAADLNQFNRLMVKAIRKVDKHTPIVLDSGLYASPMTFSYLRPVKDDKVIYSTHMYEPYNYTNRRMNKGRYTYPGHIPFGKHGGPSSMWNKRRIQQFFQTVENWRKKHKLPANRIFLGEFGLHRMSKGAARYLDDLLAVVQKNQWHWAFYSFREDTWRGMDYEVGTKPLGWRVWKAIKEGRKPKIIRKKNPLFSVILKYLHHGRNLHKRVKVEKKKANVPAKKTAKSPRRLVALTVDDLAIAGLAPRGRSALNNMKRLVRQIAPLKQSIWGFACAGRGHLNALKYWVKSGHRLANHTYSHYAYSRVPTSVYMNDIKRNEQTIRKAVGVQLKGTYFRFPYLDNGHSIPKMKTMVRYLKKHRYQLAPVSLDTVDYRFNTYYVTKKQKNAVVKAYLQHIDESAQHFEKLSRRFYKREIPLILLVHANALNGDHLWKVIQTLKKRGYQFISLKKALQDPAYKPYRYRTPFIPLRGDRNFLNQVALSKGLKIPDPSGDRHFNRYWRSKFLKLK